MKALIDTCIIIDVLCGREPFCADGQKIFLAVAAHRAEGYLSAKEITDMYYLVHKSTHSDAETRRILRTLLQLFSILDTAAIDCRTALDSEMTDFEDAVMVASAERTGMDCIVTRNIRDYAGLSLPVYTPFLINSDSAVANRSLCQESDFYNRINRQMEISHHVEILSIH